MKQWFPFTDYDFYAYLTTGMLLIAAVDYTFAGAVLVHRTEWTVVQIAFWTAVAYLVGQLVAGPSAAVLEHGVARGLLHPPLAVCLGLRQRRRPREISSSTVRQPPSTLRSSSGAGARIVESAAAALGVSPAEITDPEAVFGVAFGVSRGIPNSAARMDQFRNLYGFSRNVAFVGLIAAGLLTVRCWQAPDAAYRLVAGWRSPPRCRHVRALPEVLRRILGRGASYL